jgi:5'(3')-deoxyribonucleotidase
MVKQRLYLDMDGVLADFETGITRIGHADRGIDDDEGWAAMAATPNFFLDLPLVPDARKLFNYCYENFDVHILTALPKPHRNMPTAEAEKRKWMRIHFRDVPVITCYREEKKKYAIADDGWHPNILVDDSPSNVGEFIREGGIGILHTNADDTIAVLKELV